jgi:hypothetical protein
VASYALPDGSGRWTDTKDLEERMIAIKIFTTVKKLSGGLTYSAESNLSTNGEY